MRDIDLDRRVTEEVMGGCVHDLACDDERCLEEARAAFAEEHGVRPGAGWRPYEWEDETRLVCRKCNRRWQVGGSSLGPGKDSMVRPYSDDMGRAQSVLDAFTCQGFPVRIYTTLDENGLANGWVCEIHGCTAQANLDALPRAVCEAALAAAAR